jgi:hypothetical protein
MCWLRQRTRWLKGYVRLVKPNAFYTSVSRLACDWLKG